MSGKLSTHVLDTALGRPAGGMAIGLWYLGEAPLGARPDAIQPPGARPETVATAVTNRDGRTDAPLLSGETMRAGRYRLTFAVGAYYRGRSHPDAGRFLEEVPVEFVIDDPTAGYHVPLLVTPWSYSTYRGS